MAVDIAKLHACPICKQVYQCRMPRWCQRPEACICFSCMITDDPAKQGMITGYNASWKVNNSDGS